MDIEMAQQIVAEIRDHTHSSAHDGGWNFDLTHDEAVALVVSLLPAQEWRDMITAPRNGAMILLFVPDDDDGEIVWPAYWAIPVENFRSPVGWKHCSGGRWTAEDSAMRWLPWPTGPLFAEERTK